MGFCWCIPLLIRIATRISYISIHKYFVLKTGFYIPSEIVTKLDCFRCRDTYPMLLVANKVDLVHLRKVTEEQGRELAHKLGIPYIETSAKDPPLNIDATFHEVVRIIRNQPQNENDKRKKKKLQKLGKCAII